jgi:hypothetical protein
MFTDLFEFVYTKFPHCATLNHLLVCSRLGLTGKPPGAKRRISAEQARGKANSGRKDLLKLERLRIEKVFDELGGGACSRELCRDAASFLALVKEPRESEKCPCGTMGPSKTRQGRKEAYCAKSENYGGEKGEHEGSLRREPAGSLR